MGYEAASGCMVAAKGACKCTLCQDAVKRESMGQQLQICAMQVRQTEGLPHSGQWYCFDDVSVDPWDVANLEQDCFGGLAAARPGDLYSSPLQVISHTGARGQGHPLACPAWNPDQARLQAQAVRCPCPVQAAWPQVMHGARRLLEAPSC